MPAPGADLGNRAGGAEGKGTKSVHGVGANAEEKPRRALGGQEQRQRQHVGPRSAALALLGAVAGFHGMGLGQMGSVGSKKEWSMTRHKKRWLMSLLVCGLLLLGGVTAVGQCENVELRNVSVNPSVAAPGAQMTVSFEYKGTGPGWPHEHLWVATVPDGVNIDFIIRTSTPCQWHSETLSFAAPTVPGSYTYYLNGFGSREVSSSLCSGSSDDRKPFNFSVSQAAPPPPAQPGPGAGASFDGIGYADIAAATLSADRIDASDGVTNQLTPGAIVLYQTNEGRYGKLQVLEYGYNLRIQWHTFRPNETRHSSGELVIQGTFGCDLDAGREVTASPDFWWAMVTATERYLEPANGARFAVYGAAPPPPGMWTDKQQYAPGESISLTITIPDECNYRVMLKQPDGTSVQFAPILSSALISAPGYTTIHMTGTTGSQAGVYTATLLCATPAGPFQLGEVQYSVGTAGAGAAAEIAYDDGTAEGTRGKSSAGLGYAVRFTPPASGGTLIEARFYINSFSPSGAGPIEVRVWDASRNLVDVPIVVTPTQTGWFSVDLSGYGFTPTGDFYVGYVQLSATAHPWIGLDTSSGEGRSHNIPDWSGVLPQGVNIMIRAVLSSSQAGPPSAGPRLYTDKPQYTPGETIRFYIFNPPACSYAIVTSAPGGSVSPFVFEYMMSSINTAGDVEVTMVGTTGTEPGVHTASLYCETQVGLPFALAQTQFTIVGGGAGVPGGTSVSTNKPLYALGETITFTVTSASMCMATVRVQKPDGSITTQVLGTLLPGQTVSFAGLAGMPLGQRTVQLYCGSALAAQTTFSVGTNGGGQVPPPTGQGTLQLTSTPSGVQVFIDGQYKGVTPLTVQLAAGAHTLVFRLAGYPDLTRTITIQAGAWHSAQAQFGP